MINVHVKLCHVEGCKKIATNTLEFEDPRYLLKIPLCADHREDMDYEVFNCTVTHKRIPLEEMIQ